MIDHFYNIESIKSYTYIEVRFELISIPSLALNVINLVCIY